jgi:glycosyltransferase involved in cell wall biosynthesis
MIGNGISILSASESLILPTGYATVMKNILPRLKNKHGFEVNHIGWQHQGNPYEYDINGAKINQYMAGLTQMHDTRYPEELPSVVAKTRPHILFSLVDIWFTGGMGRYSRQLKLPYLNYFPIDGEWMPDEWFDFLELSSHPLCMSKFGKEVVEANVRNRVTDRAWGPGFEIDYIWHGVNAPKTPEYDNKGQIVGERPDGFYPIPNEYKLKSRTKMFQSLFKIEPARSKKAKVFGFFGRNTERKGIPRLFKSFSKVIKEYKGDVFLLLKVGSMVDPWGPNLYEEIEKYGLNGKVFNLGHQMPMQGCSIAELNLMYNLCDVTVSATTGEGFGLTTVESMAAGVPIIINDFTTSRELVGKDRGWLVPIIDTYCGQKNVERGLIDCDKFADTMLYALNNPEDVIKRGKAGRKWTQKNCTWDLISDKFAKKIKGIVDSQ